MYDAGNTGDGAKEDIDIAMQIDVQREHERMRWRRTVPHVARSTNSAINFRDHQNMDNDEITARIDRSRDKARREKKPSSLVVLHENDNGYDVNRKRNQNDNRIDVEQSREIAKELESRDIVQSRDISMELESRDTVQSRDQVVNMSPDRIESHEDNKAQTGKI